MFRRLNTWSITLALHGLLNCMSRLCLLAAQTCHAPSVLYALQFSRERDATHAARAYSRHSKFYEASAGGASCVFCFSRARAQVLATLVCSAGTHGPFGRMTL